MMDRRRETKGEVGRKKLARIPEMADSCAIHPL